MEENKNIEELSVEELFKQVETTIASLEAADISLEDSFAQYKKGIELLKLCDEKIDAVEKKVLVINGEGGLDEF